MNDSYLSNICKNCSKCCAPTEMPLSQGDIDRITLLGYSLDDFSIIDDESGTRILRNRKGKCYFLEGDEKPFRCIIYPYHPRGCKFFPLIYNAEKGKCTLDKEYCPHWREFEWKLESKGECEEVAAFLRDDLHLI
ncbi:MAG: YkgJ family cysteine cluster protein [Promethearchaeota archaeon]